MPDAWSAAYPDSVRRFSTFAAFREMQGTRDPPVVRRPLTVGREDREAPFSLELTSRSAGELRFHEYAGDPLTFTRSAQQIAESELDGYFLFLHMAGVWQFAQAGREQVIEAGSVILVDHNVPFRSVKRGRWRHRAILVPRAPIDDWISPDWRRGGMICGGAGLGKVIASYARVLTDEIDQLTPGAASTGLDHLCQLFAVNAAATKERQETTRSALKAAKLTQVRRYIEGHLGGALRPAQVAAANGLSERNLHLLFEPTGTTFGVFVQQRRLEQCRAMLASPAFAHRPVTDIAFAWGFNSLPTFYRSFRQAFGVAPGDLREAAKGRQ